MNSLSDKREAVEKRLDELERVAVAFSGGIDSRLLLALSKNALGVENVIAVIVDSPFFTRGEIADAIEYSESIGVPCVVVDMDALAIEGIRKNTSDRCYLCKKEIFERVVREASQRGIGAVLDGSNLDDASDWRPGFKAKCELWIESPLLDAHITKSDVRQLAKDLGIEAWNMPSSPCLATRFAFGEEITEKRLTMIEESEGYLLGLGFRDVRVRTHGKDDAAIARIEVNPEDFGKLSSWKMRSEISERLKSLGYAYVSIDLIGYVRGNMNRQIEGAR